MAQYDRPPKQKVKRPDEFISFFDHVVRFFMVHQGKFIGLMVLILLALSGYGLWTYYQGKQAKEVAKFYEAALNAQGEEGITDWRTLIEQNPPLSLKAIASLELGGRLAKAGDWKGAAEAFQETTHAKEELIHNIGLWAMGVSWENAGDFDKAEAAFKQLAADKTDPFHFYGLLGQARILAQNSQAVAAEKILTELLGQGSEVPLTVQKMVQAQLLSLWLSS